MRQTLADIAKSFHDVLFFDGFSYLCDSDTHCTLGEKNKAFYSDRHHLSYYGQMWLYRHYFGEIETFIRSSGKHRVVAAQNEKVPHAAHWGLLQLPYSSRLDE